ncbi:MerR family transcriptional regulator [Nitratireductor luteus]|uniref:MerR family transcriptional regulator n=1 Tax=Nitratireductor luteus TaxID=2976980 RepID=UPI00223F71A4|nr:MerR family DNA-binding transcriptional regulator [Nitratireductor luteus]
MRLAIALYAAHIAVHGSGCFGSDRVPFRHGGFTRLPWNALWHNPKKAECPAGKAVMASSIPWPANAPAANDISDDESYYRIGELAREFDVTLRALRFYEDKGLIRPMRRGTTRLYSSNDRARLSLILLGRKIGFPLIDVKHILDLYDPRGTNVRQLKAVLEKSERQMEQLERQYIAVEEAVGELTKLIGDIRSRLDHAEARENGQSKGRLGTS